MKINELVEIMPTQFKQTSNENKLKAGHSVRLLGHWTKEEGFVKKQSLSYTHGSGVVETLSCPVVAIVTEKFGEYDVTLDIIGKTSEEWETYETTQKERTITHQKWRDAEETETVELRIPRFTRPGATFVLSGLGTKVWDIESVTDDFTLGYNISGKVEFYALASPGAKVVYWFSIHKIAQMLRSIVQPWIHPSHCERCSGTGIEPDTEDTTCNQCLGYGYSGPNSIKYVQRKQGFDVGLQREQISDWENMSDAEWKNVEKFINKCWTQRWWVTPTKSEIKRLFAHFYNIGENEILIDERFHDHEPIWYLDIPQEGSLASPFGTATDDDRDLMKYVAESVTPAGVSVFVGFYQYRNLGDLQDFTDDTFFEPFAYTSTEHRYSLWGQPRWDFWNGWCECTEDFEVESFSETDFVPDPDGRSSLINANDQGRHWVQMDNNSIIEITGSTIGNVEQSGYAEVWMHPCEGVHEFGVWDETNSRWMCKVYHSDDAFYDNDGNKLRDASRYSDYNLSLYFDADQNIFTTKINRENCSCVYPSTYLTSPTAGDYTSDPTSLDFVDSATLYDGALHIMDVLGHKGVLRLQDDATAAEDPYIQHNITQATSGTREFYIGSNDVSDLNAHVAFYEDSTGLINIYIYNGDLKYQDNAGTHIITSLTDNVFYHIKIVWYADNTQDIYVDGILEVDGANLVNNQSSGLNKLTVIHYSDSTDYFYLDAWGDPDNDTMYNIGDNLSPIVSNEYDAYESNFENTGTIDASTTFLLQEQDQASGNKMFVDNFGCSFDSEYETGDNWQRLYPIGWGLTRSDELSGMTDIYERYVGRDRPIIF